MIKDSWITYFRDKEQRLHLQELLSVSWVTHSVKPCKDGVW